MLNNAEKYNGSTLKIEGPKNTIGTQNTEFKPNHNNQDLLKTGKKAELQA